MHRNGPAGHPNTYKFTMREFSLRKSFRQIRRTGWKVIGGRAVGLAVLSLSSVFLAAQASTAAPASQSAPSSQNPNNNSKDQGIPDAPSTVQPPKPAPENPMPTPESPGGQGPQTPSENQAPPRESAPQPTNPATQPPVNIRTVPQGG